MHLKSLEIIGFKSFPEKTKLEFSPGMTVVVGPNGCGKSNLVDAVRWGLGEQSAKLMRGSKMEELIFGGSAQRNPLNFAEVSLVFDNVDRFLPLEYQEIAVTRRMYRSGEGEYYLNKTPCRLKDVTELFWDTGIGTETYSLIAQGKVEQLLNARPEEHRELFEEAAEIRKYKQRKKEATVRLHEMGHNLLRIEDLLAELKKQHLSLSQAAALAKKYKELSEQLSQIEKKILFKKWLTSEQLLGKIKKKVQSIDFIKKGKNEQLQVLKEKKEHVSLQKGVKLKELEFYKELFSQQKNEVENMRHSLNLLNEKKKSILDKNLLKEETLQEYQERIFSLEEACHKNEAELKRVQGERQLLGERALPLEDRLAALKEEKKRMGLEALRQQVMELNLRKNSLEQAFKNGEAGCRELSIRRKELEEEEEGKDREAEQLSRTMEETAASFQKVELLQKEHESELRVSLKESERTSVLLKEKEKENSKLQDELLPKNTHLKYLRAGEKNFSLYHDGVKAVLQASWQEDGPLKNIYGPVAGLISVSPEYERAIDVALGAAAQFIVVADDLSAGLAIKYLKENKAGRATFLPLNLLKSPIQRKAPSLEGSFLEAATRLVKTPENFKKAVEYLLGGVLIAENLETALTLARAKKSWKIVTLEGELITPGGAISGGYQPKKNHGFLARKNELKRLEAEVLALEQKKENNCHELKKLKDRLEKQLQNHQDLELKSREIDAALSRDQSSMKILNIEKKRLSQELKELRQKKEKLSASYRTLSGQVEEITEELALVSKELALKKKELKNLGQKMLLEEEKVKKLEKKLVEMRIASSVFQEKESSLQQLLREQNEEKKRLNLLLGEFCQEKAAFQEQLKQLQAEEIMLRESEERKKEEVARAEEMLIFLEKEIESYKQQKEELTAERAKQLRSLERYEKNYQHLSLEHMKAEERSKYLKEQLLDRFKVTPEAVDPGRFLGEEPEELLVERKKGLIEDISVLGDVNLGAIGEYERLQGRISFLEEQRQDLLKGEKGIQKIIGELEQYMEESFLQALDAIGKNFLDVFTELFGGGQAFLKLSDPENVLDSGIEIVAQPPGKKLQNISLLSGGEKTLTVIALLFALLQYKPVPFCVLDEIDSSLDDNNLARFLSYLRKHVRETQFIIITHRRPTMEEADELYGITMEEKGISKIISMDLTKKAG